MDGTTVFGILYSRLLWQCQNVQSPENLAAVMAPRDENALLMQRMEDSSLCQLWQITNMLIKVRNGALTQENVKNRRGKWMGY